MVFTAYRQILLIKEDSIFSDIKLHLYPWKHIKNYRTMENTNRIPASYLVACILSTDLIQFNH